MADAIRSKDDANLREELGDLLLQVVMHAEIAREAGRFTIEEVAREIGDKLVRRHPHVFGESEARDTGAVLKQWDEIKRAEKKSEEAAYFSGLTRALPALMLAQKTQTKAARVNFDWSEMRDVIAKVDEELAEAKEAIALRRTGGDRGRNGRPPFRGREPGAEKPPRRRDGAGRGDGEIHRPFSRDGSANCSGRAGSWAKSISRRWMKSGTG